MAKDISNHGSFKEFIHLRSKCVNFKHYTKNDRAILDPNWSPLFLYNFLCVVLFLGSFMFHL